MRKPYTPEYRQKVVSYAQKHGPKAAALKFEPSVESIRIWLRKEMARGPKVPIVVADIPPPAPAKEKKEKPKRRLPGTVCFIGLRENDTGGLSTKVYYTDRPVVLRLELMVEGESVMLTPEQALSLSSQLQKFGKSNAD